MNRVFRAAMLCLALCLCGCGSGGGTASGNSSNNPANNETTRRPQVVSLGNFAGTIDSFHSQVYQYAQAATDDFTVNIDEMLPSVDATVAAEQLMFTPLPHVGRALGESVDIVEELELREEPIVNHGTNHTVRQQLAFSTFALITGAAMVAVTAFAGLDGVYEARSDSVRKRLEDGEQEELDAIGEQLGTPAGAPREELQKKFDKDLTYAERQEKVREIEFVALTDDRINIESADVTEAFLNGIRKAGQTAANTVGGIYQMVIGLPRLASAVLGAVASEPESMSVRVVDPESGEKVADGDVDAERVNVVVVSEETEEVLVDEPDEPVDLDTARENLDRPSELTIGEWDATLTTILDELAERGADVESTPEGTRANVPRRSLVHSVDDPAAETEVHLPGEMGPATVVVNGDGGSGAQTYEQVDPVLVDFIDYVLSDPVDGGDNTTPNNVTPNNVTPNNITPNNSTSGELVFPNSPFKGLQIEYTVEGANLGASTTETDAEAMQETYEMGRITSDTVVVSGTVTSFNQHSGVVDMDPEAEASMVIMVDGTEVDRIEDVSGSTTGTWSRDFRLEASASGALFVQFQLAVYWADGTDTGLVTVGANLLNQ